jgi:ABC-type glycerol-3-phosphate transport system permease component
MFQVLAPPQPLAAPAGPERSSPGLAAPGRRLRPAAGRAVRLSRRAVLTLACILVIAPLVWMLLAVFRPTGSVFASWIPVPPRLDSIVHALHALPWGELLLHTVLVAVGVSAGQLLTGLLAAYGLCCWRFPGRRLVLLLIVGSWLVPFQVTILPNYVLIARLGLLNSVTGVVLPQLSSAFAVLLLRQHLADFPGELLEAARVDGLSSWSILWRVVVPNLAPSLAALEILLFIGAWNEYLWPLVVYNTPDSVLQVGIRDMLNVNNVDYGALLAAAGLATLPLLILYLVLQRRVVDAFVRSGLR